MAACDTGAVNLRSILCSELLAKVKLRAKLAKIRSKCSQDGNCLLWPEESTTREGYGRCFLSYPGHSAVRTTVHRAVYIIHFERPDLIRHKGTVDVSHLCHRKRCIEVQHLTLESRANNMLRNGCRTICVCGQEPHCVL